MKWITAGFVLFLTTIIFMVDVGVGPAFFRLIQQIPGGDKVGHFFLMGTLSLLVNKSLSARKVKVSSLQFLLGSLIVTSVVTLEEISQLFIVGRTFSFFDLFFDYAGIAMFGQMAAYLFAKKSESLDLQLLAIDRDISPPVPGVCPPHAS